MTPIVWITRLLVGAYPQWHGSAPTRKQRIYFANHTSHLDTIVIWSALPGALRSTTRPVAAKDYWTKGLIRRRLAMKELNVVLVDRRRTEHTNPLEPLKDALAQGDSLIIFPEGTRRPQELPSEFICGLWLINSRVHRKLAPSPAEGNVHSGSDRLLRALRCSPCAQRFRSESRIPRACTAGRD